MSNRDDAVRVEKLEPGTTCVWCWKEITAGQPALELKKGSRAHLACDSRMLNFIKSLGEWTE